MQDNRDDQLETNGTRSRLSVSDHHNGSPPLPQHSDRNDQLNDSVEIIRKNYQEYQADNSQSMIKHDRLQSRYTDIPILSQQSSHLSFDDILGDDKIEKPILVSRPASPRQAAFLGYTNALIDELTHAMTPTLALTVLTRIGVQSLKHFWVGGVGILPALLASLPIIICSLIYIQSNPYSLRANNIKYTLGICVLINVLCFCLFTALFTFTANTLTHHYPLWNTIIALIISLVFFSSAIAYKQYLLIRRKAQIENDLEIQETDSRPLHIVDNRKTKLKSIILFWSAFVEAISIAGMAYAFFKHYNGFKPYSPLSCLMWAVIGCIALSHLVKTIHSDASEVEKSLDQLDSSEHTGNWRNKYRIIKYTSSKKLDKLIVGMICFSYQLTPMLENTMNWIALYLLYKNIQLLPHFSTLNINLFFSGYALLCVLILAGEYFFEYAADRKWLRTNANLKYTNHNATIKWRAQPSFFGRILLSAFSLPVIIYCGITKEMHKKYSKKTADQLVYQTACVSKILGHIVFIAALSLEIYYLLFRSHPGLIIAIGIIGCAVIIGILKGDGQSSARRLEAENLSRLITDQTLDAVFKKAVHQRQNTELSHERQQITKKIYQSLHLHPNQRLILSKKEMYFVLASLSFISITALHYFHWIQLPTQIYWSFIGISIFLGLLSLLYQCKDLYKENKTPPPDIPSTVRQKLRLKENQHQRQTHHRENTPIYQGHQLFTPHSTYMQPDHSNRNRKRFALSNQPKQNLGYGLSSQIYGSESNKTRLSDDQNIPSIYPQNHSNSD
jgi:hypothetical protein